MAKKVNALKLAQQTRGRAEFTDRPPATVSPALYLMQLRLPKSKISPLKKRLPIDMDAETRAQIEHPVEIKHVG
jgi:hypothetical protein